MAWDGNRYGDGAGASTLSDLGTVTGITGPQSFKQVIMRAAAANSGTIYYGGTKGTLTSAGAYAWGYLAAGESRTILTDFSGNLSKVAIIGSDTNQICYVEVVLGPPSKNT